MWATDNHIIVCCILVTFQLIRAFVDQATLLTCIGLWMFGLAMPNHVKERAESLITAVALVLLVLLSMLGFDMSQQLPVVGIFLTTLRTNARSHFFPCYSIGVHQLPVVLKLGLLAKAKTAGLTGEAIVSKLHMVHQIAFPREGLPTAGAGHTPKRLHRKVNRLMVLQIHLPLVGFLATRVITLELPFRRVKVDVFVIPGTRGKGLATMGTGPWILNPFLPFLRFLRFLRFLWTRFSALSLLAFIRPNWRIGCRLRGRHRLGWMAMSTCSKKLNKAMCVIIIYHN